MNKTFDVFYIRIFAVSVRLISANFVCRCEDFSLRFLA